MKKILSIALALVMVFALVGVAQAAEEVKVAMITDYGDITDQSFNQTTYEACKAFCEGKGLDFQYYKPASDSDEDRISSIEKAIDDGFNVIVMPGYAFGPAIKATAEKNAEVTFIALDVSEFDLGYEGAIPANLYSAVYQEELCGYMAGYAAVKLGYKKLGFLGGMAVPAVVYGNQFFGDADITAYMDTWYSADTEVVFACGGGIFTSAGESAKKYGKKVIGVDVDQAATIDGLYGEGITVTSAMKGLAATVNSMLGKVVDGTFEGGKVENLGLVSAVPEENFVQIAGSTQFSDSFTTEDYAALVAKMFAGEVTVSNDIEKTAADFATVITVSDQGNIK